VRRGKSSQAQPGDQVQEQRDWGQKEREESEPALEHGAVLVLTEDRDPAVPAEWAFVRLVNHPGDPAVVLVDRDVGRRRRSAEPAGERLAGPGLDDNAKRHRDPSCRLGCRGRVPASGDLLERGVNRRIADEVVAPDFATDPVDPLLTGLALADVSTPPAAISDSVPIPRLRSLLRSRRLYEVIGTRSAFLPHVPRRKFDLHVGRVGARPAPGSKLREVEAGTST